MKAADFWTFDKVPEQITAPAWSAMIAAQAERLRERGCTWLRATVLDDSAGLYMEGWLIRQDVDPPFDQAELKPERKI